MTYVHKNGHNSINNWPIFNPKPLLESSEAFNTQNTVFVVSNCHSSPPSCAIEGASIIPYKFEN